MVVFRVLVCFASLALLGIAGRPVMAQWSVPTVLNVPLFPELDQFGNQFEVVQAYEDPLNPDPNTNKSITSGLYDTGASLISFSAADQEYLFQNLYGYPPIPTIPGAVATADAIGGTITGLMSREGKIYAGGGSAITIDFNSPKLFSFDLSNTIAVGGVKAFVGTSGGSQNLPSIVGTPINVPTGGGPGWATVLDQSGYSVDLSDLDPAFAGIDFQFPDVRFVAPGSAATNMVPTSSTYERVTIPVSLFGPTANPANDISVAPNPIQNNTAVAFTPSGGSQITVSDQKFLFDTGAQLSIISPAIAAQFGLTDLDGNPLVTPVDTIDVQGAGEQVQGLPGYTLDSLTLPRTDGGFVNFTDVHVYVLDVGFGIDGILGTNLFNAADSFMYDPYNPAGAQLSVLFLHDRDEQGLMDEAGLFVDPENELSIQIILDALGSRYSANQVFLPGFQFVPEPSTWCLALTGLVAIALRLLRKRR